jgi:2-oxoglutarate dehydrogenase E1 component
MVKEMESEFKEMLEGQFDQAKQIAKNVIVPFMEDEWMPYPPAKGSSMHLPINTGADRGLIEAAARALTTLPEGKKFLNKVVRLLADRRAMVFDRNALDWGMAENLAYATLLQDGYSVRISGEDVERGTFSHRHAVLKLEDSEEEYIPMNAVPGKKGRFAIYNSHLSEYAVLGFDYGYAMASPETLVIWEAQFGDFANGAQIIIDQFISAAEDKWKTQNGLVMLLPHGYEGQGAEHSSARLERFLQLCAQDNMAVCNPTTPANHFHLLRRSMHWTFRKPLVVMSPKSLLRHPKAVSTVEELTQGGFQPLIGDSLAKPSGVVKVVFCSGKLYYELEEERTKRGCTDTAIVRLEQLYPLPIDLMKAELAKYPADAKLVWSQEEPANMGAWTFMLANCELKLHRVSSPASAATASGSHQAAHHIQHRLIAETFDC